MCALLRAAFRTTQEFQYGFDQRVLRHAAQPCERDRIHRATMIALRADEQNVELSEVIRETSDGARHASILKSIPIRRPSSTRRRKILYGLHERLRGHGLGASAIMEVIAMSALAAYANIIADATRVEAEPMFEQL